MHYKLVFIACLLFAVKGWAQSTAGITGQRDTSYGNQSAYEGTKKTHPDIKLVTEFSIPAVASQKNLVYTSVGRRDLLTDVFYPGEKSNTKRIPLIMIHGGGWRTGNKTQHYPLAQKLAALGYVCFTPEYRLSTEALFPAAVYDLKALIRWIKNNAAQFNIDTAKVVAMGFSAGGQLAAFLGVTGNMPLFAGTNGEAHATPTNVYAVVDMDGILSFTHPESGEGDDSKRISAATYWFGYPKKGHEKIWEAGSSLNYVSYQTPPTLFLNSSVDRMHAGREDYIRELNKYDIYTEVHSFPNAPHGFPLFDPWFEPTIQYIDQFIKRISQPVR